MADSPTDVPAEVLADAEAKAQATLIRLRAQRGEPVDTDAVTDEIHRQLQGEAPGPLGQVDHIHEPTTTAEDRAVLKTVLQQRDSPGSVPADVLADADAKVRALAEQISADTSRTFAYERGGQVHRGYDGLTDVEIVQYQVILDTALEDLQRRREGGDH